LADSPDDTIFSSVLIDLFLAGDFLTDLRMLPPSLIIT
jgi:hypothetical protein